MDFVNKKFFSTFVPKYLLHGRSYEIIYILIKTSFFQFKVNHMIEKHLRSLISNECKTGEHERRQKIL